MLQLIFSVQSFALSIPLSPQYLAAFKSGVPHWSISGFQPHLSCDRVHGKGTTLG